MGGLFGSSSPTVSTTATEDLEEEETKAKALRTALLETEGGITGQELTTGQVQKRSTLFGN